MDVLDSQPSPSAIAEQAPAASPSCSDGTAGPLSLLDDWEHWPENDPRFDPLFDNAWPLREHFCKCKRPTCEFCSETREVFHVCEYTADGQNVMDKKINVKELHEHLQELERVARLDVKAPDHPVMHMFFACNNYVHGGGPRFAYMRRFLAYCRIPPHFFIRDIDLDSPPAFQAAYKSSDGNNTSPSPRRGILHIYLQPFSYIMGDDIIANAHYYSTEFGAKIRDWAKSNNPSPLSPSLYVRYDESSQECVVYVADDTQTWRVLRDAFATDRARGENQDPFLLVAIFLQHRVADLHKYVSNKRLNMQYTINEAKKLASLDTESTALFARFGYLASDGPGHARMVHEASSMLRALGAIEAEHLLFLQRGGNPEGDATAQMIQRRFRQQREHLLELESAFSALVKGIEIVKDLMAGRAQLLNGIDMAKMARDNQTQAVATEALARDARRDSEIMKRDSATMKTITVVTLVYLPATFVSTLLSMGVFDFGAGSGGDGQLRIAREGWVFLAISLPLTILTLGLAFLWKQSKERQWKREDAATAKQKGEKSTAGTTDEAVHLPAPDPVTSGDSAQKSPGRGERLLAAFQHLRRRSAPGDLENGGTVKMQ